MKKFWLVFLIAVLLAINFSAPAFATPPDFGDNKVVRLYDDDGDFVCTGFFIEPPLTEPEPNDYFNVGSVWIVTAAHCTGGSYLTIKINDFLSVGVKEYARISLPRRHGKEIVDLAILVMPAGYAEVKTSDLADKDATPGSAVFFHGFPQGIESIGKYTVRELTDEEKGYNVAMTHSFGGKVHLGASGSPVFNMEGKVVGVLWGMHQFTDEYAYFTPVSKLNDLLEVLDLREEANYPDSYM